jgi:hypothetical protein
MHTVYGEVSLIITLFSMWLGRSVDRGINRSWLSRIVWLVLIIWLSEFHQLTIDLILDQAMHIVLL